MNSAVTDATTTLRAGELTASYDLVYRKSSEDWVAIGSIASASASVHKPVWLIVGTGTLPSEAIAHLQRALEREADRSRLHSNVCFHSADG